MAWIDAAWSLIWPWDARHVGPTPLPAATLSTPMVSQDYRLQNPPRPSGPSNVPRNDANHTVSWNPNAGARPLPLIITNAIRRATQMTNGKMQTLPARALLRAPLHAGEGGV